jgi:hypothetical protein
MVRAFGYGWELWNILPEYKRVERTIREAARDIAHAAMGNAPGRLEAALAAVTPLAN